MNEERRLIEVAFPLKQTSLDSVHEKNVRHGHISTLHIWPARRPLAASRAALIATLLPDPDNTEERKQILERLGGRLVTRVKKKNFPMAGLRNRPAKRRRAASCTGDAKAARTSTGSATKSAQPTVGAPPKCSTPSRAAAQSPWKLCVWAAM